MFFKHFIRILGCLFVIAAMGLLMWLPATPWAALTISSPALATPATFSLTGYDGFIIADSAVGLAKFGERAADALGDTGDAVQTIFGLPAAFRLPEPLQTELDGLSQTIWLFIGVQAAMLALPLLTTFMALIVLFSSSSMTWQMMRGALLLILTVATIVLLAGGFIYLSRLFDLALPDLQTTLLAGAVTIELKNTMNWRLAAAAGIGGLFGAAAALLGAALTAKSPSYAMPLYSIAMPTPMDAGPPASDVPAPTPAEPMPPTIRLAKEQPPVVPQAAPPATILSRRCAHCGTENGVNARFCSKCGKALN